MEANILFYYGIERIPLCLLTQGDSIFTRSNSNTLSKRLGLASCGFVFNEPDLSPAILVDVASRSAPAVHSPRTLRAGVRGGAEHVFAPGLR